jgi:ankyrin repeat protein
LNAKYTVDQVNTKDHRGNTALYYAAKNQNLEFMNNLLNFGADSSVICEKGKTLSYVDNTPLHHIFKTNNINLIIRCLCSHKTPNLNALNS